MATDSSHGTTLPASAELAPFGGPGSGRSSDAVDPELLALPAPPKGERTATVVLMVITAIAALMAGFSLRGEASYAFTKGAPTELGELATLRPSAELSNTYVRGTGLLATQGAIKYGRPLEGDSFRLAKLAGTSNVWVEIRVPEGFEGPRFVPPSTFAGRLVPLADVGLRHLGLADAIRAGGTAELPADTWVLIDGCSPRGSRWATALTLLFAGFAAWNLLGVARVLRRVRDRSARPAASARPSA